MLNLGAFGAMVRRVRRERGLTQGELALRAGVEIKTVRRIERGEGNPYLETLWSVAAALDTTLGELVRAAEGGEGS